MLLVASAATRVSIEWPNPLAALTPKQVEIGDAPQSLDNRPLDLRVEILKRRVRQHQVERIVGIDRAGKECGDVALLAQHRFDGGQENPVGVWHRYGPLLGGRGSE